MNAPTAASGNLKAAAPPRFDAKFVAEHNLIERYLQNKLPAKGALDLENWCRANPDYLNNLKLSERAQASLKLLEASGRPLDLQEPKPPWWKSFWVPVGLAVTAFLSLAAFWSLTGKYVLLRSELRDTKEKMHQGSLVQPATEANYSIAPDRAPGIDKARIVVNSVNPQLVDLHIDMTYTLKLMQFRMVIDKRDQGRAMILNNVLKDSNNEIRMTFNTTGVSVGVYTIRIEALPPRGTPIPEGWFLLDVR